jgi:hypothetical protein
MYDRGEILAVDDSNRCFNISNCWRNESQSGHICKKSISPHGRKSRVIGFRVDGLEMRQSRLTPALTYHVKMNQSQQVNFALRELRGRSTPELNELRFVLIAVLGNLAIWEWTLQMMRGDSGSLTGMRLRVSTLFKCDQPIKVVTPKQRKFAVLILMVRLVGTRAQ